MESQELIGSIDLATPDLVMGWVALKRNNAIERVRLDLVVNGERVADIQPSVFRQDLFDAGIGTGDYSFAYRPETSLKAGDIISLQREGTQNEINAIVSAPQSLQFREVEDFVGNLDACLSDAISGWVAKRVDHEYIPAQIDLYIAGEFRETLFPSEFRDDLLQAGIGNGCFAFKYFSLGRYKAGETIELRSSSSKNLILTGVVQEQLPTSSELKEKKREIGAEKVVTNVNPEIFNILDRLVLHIGDYDKTTINNAGLIAIYVTYTNSGRFFFHQRRQVESLRAAGFFVVAVHATRQPNLMWYRRKLGDVDLFKLNIGYDFGSWWVGIKWLKSVLEVDLTRKETIILMNDSCFGNISKEDIIKTTGTDCDLFGVTESREKSHHIQSYFISASNSLVWSGAFVDSLLAYDFPDEKMQVVERGEVRISGEARDAGAKLGCLVSYNQLTEDWIVNLDRTIAREKELLSSRLGFTTDLAFSRLESRFLDVFNLLRRGVAMNPSHFFANSIIRAGVPLLKRELFLLNPADIPDYLTVCYNAIYSDIISFDEIEEFVEAEGVSNFSLTVLRVLR